jgi:hypothetical protein
MYVLKNLAFQYLTISLQSVEIDVIVPKKPLLPRPPPCMSKVDPPDRALTTTTKN